MQTSKINRPGTSVAEKSIPLSELEARLKFFPRLRDIFISQLRSRRIRKAISSQPLLGWLVKFGQDPSARELVFGIERALAELVEVPGYRKLSSALKAPGEKFWPALGHLSLAAFFRGIGWGVQVEAEKTGSPGKGPVDLLVRLKGEGIGIELKSVGDLASGWTQADYRTHYRDTPQFLEEIRKYPGLEPVPLRDRKTITRLVRSRASKAQPKVDALPRVLALDCSRSQEDAFLREALAAAGDFGMEAVVTFSVGGTDLYPETRKIAKQTPWLETPLGSAFRSAWEGADSRYASLRNEAERITSILQREYDPEAILLFGSVVRGRVRETSDLDILVIKRTEKSYWERVSEVLSLAKPSLPLHVFVYTPEEFEDRKRKQDLFISQEVLPYCERVYERPQALA